MSAPFTHKLQEGWTRFTHGGFECTVITDGPIHMGRPHPLFKGGDEGEINRLLTGNFLSLEQLSFDQNALVVNTGTHLVLFDTGCGTDPELLQRELRPVVGRLASNMRLAGIDPADIDIVALTHGHPDHAWGLAGADGEALFPNARVAIDPRELKYWTNPDALAALGDDAENQQMRDFFIGAQKNLKPYIERGRIQLVEDKSELAPGISAISTPGHTTGHTSYRIESEGQTLIVWGDLCHHQVLLLEHPEWGFSFDDDSAEAIDSRQRILAEVARDRLSILAYHFPFPGRGHLVEHADGRYRWLPAPLQLYWYARTPLSRPGHAPTPRLRRALHD